MPLYWTPWEKEEFQGWDGGGMEYKMSLCYARKQKNKDLQAGVKKIMQRHEWVLNAYCSVKVIGLKRLHTV